jgi:hypothetical protein
MDYFEEAKQIWKSFVPKSGQAETVQGELLRAVEKLRDEALRNGNMNWDEGFEILLNYLENKLTDNKVFSEEKIGRIKLILARLKNFDNPYLKDDLYDELGDRVVDYYKFYGSQIHKINLDLYR